MMVSCWTLWYKDSWTYSNVLGMLLLQSHYQDLSHPGHGPRQLFCHSSSPSGYMSVFLVMWQNSEVLNRRLGCV